eukprot:SAG11_NODE_9734_length_884_cov_2.355414_1_plen_117_part_00
MRCGLIGQALAADTGDRASQRAETKQFFKQRLDERAAERAAAKGAGAPRPAARYMAEVPESLIFLFRVLGLIRGLCTTLEVKLPCAAPPLLLSLSLLLLLSLSLSPLLLLLLLLLS